MQHTRRVLIYFYTSNVEKYLQARLILVRHGIELRHFRSRSEPYREDYALGKEAMLAAAIAEISSKVGNASLFFVEDTSLRIDALSTADLDYPGLAVKEWFQATSFADLDKQIRRSKKGRSATIKSDIALHVPGLSRPIFFHGETCGRIAESAPNFQANKAYPWLTPSTFNGWFIPAGQERRLGEMDLPTSLKYDFRAKSLADLAARLGEYGAVLNSTRAVYVRSSTSAKTSQLSLFSKGAPSFLFVGRTCAGKTTAGEYLQRQYGLRHIEASDELRSIDCPECAKLRGFHRAKCVLERMGNDVVARRIHSLLESELTNGFVITGFRTIEEMIFITERFPSLRVVLVGASERLRFGRFLERSRPATEHVRTLKQFRAYDQKQWSFGLLRVSEEFAHFRILNESTIEVYQSQIDAVFHDLPLQVSGVSRKLKPRHGPNRNRVYRCLRILDRERRPLTCHELEDMSTVSGPRILHNNVNKILKGLPGLVNRLESEKSLLRYEITASGRIYMNWLGGGRDIDDE